MAQQRNQLDLQELSCSICLDLLKDPVSTSCGHSYCRDCIEAHWDTEDRMKTYSCPQCPKTLRRRLVLQENVTLAGLVEKVKKTRLQAAAADHCYAGPEDVACDVCTGRKRKSVKSCLGCLISYCENHLQSHYDSSKLKKHQLVEPSKNLQENICSPHGKMMKIFCRTDQEVICYLCTMDEHKGHESISAAAERKKKQKKLKVSRLNIQQRIQDRQKDVKMLQQELEAIRVSADKAVEDSEEMFTHMIRLLQKRGRDVEQQIRSQQKTEESRVKELQEKLEQEIRDLKRKDAELKQLSDTPDHSQFLHNYPSVSALSESTHSSSIIIRPLRHFEDVTAAVKELRDKIQDILRDTWTNISLTITEVDVLLPQPEPKTRDEFLKYSREITLDPNTANRRLELSEGNRKATFMVQPQSYPDHPDRFTECLQVLSKESLTGRCYWEVKWRGGEGEEEEEEEEEEGEGEEEGEEEGEGEEEEGEGVYVAVAYKSICRAGGFDECGFGQSDNSWALHCDIDGYEFSYNNISTPVSGRQSSTIGVYLDHRAGLLSFYSVSKTMTLLHRVQTTFTEPLHAGVYLYTGTTAEFLKLK
ncbi:tripartite motif-containing protein 16-like [Amphiprion ocellaris]|uniref:Tripartite motif-containing protein 16-like n=1 Tax=Amphiprion ocellaris TaxID=80972 RepID=A0AAQ5ZZI2_AMPOC|nr:tripartite motif-containing protein 16-like [Amphiprion ocellaris]